MGGWRDHRGTPGGHCKSGCCRLVGGMGGFFNLPQLSFTFHQFSSEGMDSLLFFSKHLSRIRKLRSSCFSNCANEISKSLVYF